MPSVLRQIAGGEHLVQFYDDEARLVEVVGAFVAQALSAPEESALIIATAEHVIAFENELRARGFDPAVARRDGRLRVVDASAALTEFLVNGLPDPGRFATALARWSDRARQEKRRLRAYGEMVNVLWQRGDRLAAQQLEELWCVAVKDQAFPLLCAYSMDGFATSDDVGAFDEVCRHHSQVLSSGTAADSTSGEHLRTMAALEQRARALELEVARRKELEGQLVAADKRKDEFLAMLAHELRNPLAALNNAFALLSREDSVPTRLTDTCERQLGHLSRMVDDLLDVSRISTGKIELRRSRVDLLAIVQHAVQTTRPLIEERKHRLALLLSPGAFFVHGDPTRLEQVVTNLLNNAAKYTDLGGQLSISLGEEGGSAVIEVRDNGIGIPPQMLAQVFELFTQVAPTIDRSRGGLGIGLTLVRKLVELHGGEVSAQSEGLGTGARFTFRIPLDKTPQPTAAVVRRAKGGSHRILLVEDNEDVRETLKELLEELGHAVEVAEDGESGLKKLLEMGPDIALIDVGLPGIDGFELARRARAQPQGAQVFLVALTGYGGREVAAQVSSAGFDRHALKPIRVDDLIELLNVGRPSASGRAGLAQLSVP
jgi:signal transduction histidine kinase/ActR/RegA family two-component response regulator